MLIHNLKMINAAGRKNGWVLAELFLVFIVLWALMDMVGTMTYNLLRPLGYDIEHVYQLTTSVGGEARDTTRNATEKHMEIVHRLRTHTEFVEEVGCCFWSLPMGVASRYGNLQFADSMAVNLRRQVVDAGYMNVFRFELEDSKNFAEMPTNGMVALSRAAYDEIIQKCPAFTPDSLLHYSYENSYLRLFGIVKTLRDYRFGDYAKWSFIRMDDAAFLEDAHRENRLFDIVLRIRPNADAPDFRRAFLEKVAPTLDVDDCFVTDLIPYSETLRSYEQMSGEMNTVQSSAFIAAFLLINVFLGLIGTFWYRTRRRRSEIALRMSMGSSRAKIFRQLVGEGLLLLTIAAIPAALICYNVGIADPMLGQIHLIIPYPLPFSFGRFLIGTFTTWILMAVMIVAGVCLPARQAMKIEPAEALHEE